MELHIAVSCAKAMLQLLSLLMHISPQDSCNCKACRKIEGSAAMAACILLSAADTD